MRVELAGKGDKWAEIYFAKPTKSEPWPGYIVTVQNFKLGAQGATKPYSLDIAKGWATAAMEEWHATGEFPWQTMTNHRYYRMPRKPQLGFDFSSDEATP